MSIVIVTYNNEKCIEACLTSIYDSFPAMNIEILVVGNCSVDKVAAIVQEKYEHVKVITNKENVDFAAAVNQDIRVAATDVIILLNSDVIVNKKALD